MSEWQPIETAPKDGTTILLTDGRHVVAGAFAPHLHGERYPFAFIDDWSDVEADNFIGGVSANAFAGTYNLHWMPFPPAPVLA